MRRGALPAAGRADRAVAVSPLDPARLEHYDSLFIAPHGDDVALACPARVLAEAESGRKALVLALFEPVGSDANAARAVRDLGADYAAAGLASAAERAAGGRCCVARGRRARSRATAHGDRAARAPAPRLRTARPRGLADHRLAYEASLRAFAGEAGPQPLPVRGTARGLRPGRGEDAARAARGAAAAGCREARRSARASLRHLWRIGRAGASARRERSGIGARFSARAESLAAAPAGGALESAARARPAPAPGRPRGRRGRPRARAGRGAPAAAEGPARAGRARRGASTPARSALGEEARRRLSRRAASGWCCPRATACRRSSTRSRRGRAVDPYRAAWRSSSPPWRRPRLGAGEAFDVARIERPRVLKAADALPARGSGHRHGGVLAAQRRRAATTTSPRRTTGGPTRRTPAGRTSSATASATRTTSTSTGARCAG